MPQLGHIGRLASLLWCLSTPLYCLGQDATQTQQQLAAVSEAIAEIGDWLNAANADQSQQQSALQAAELALSEASNAVAEIESRIASSQARLTDLQAQQRELNVQRARQEELLAQIIQAAYKGRQQSFLKTLLNQEDPGKAGRMMHYAAVFSRYQAEQIEAYQSTLARLQQLNTELNGELDALNTRQTQLAAEQASLLANKEERAAALQALTTAIQSRNAELEQLELDRAELEELLAEIARSMEGIRSFEDVPPLPERRGALLSPLTGTLLSNFGASYGGGSLQRQGIVIGADEGSPVRAVHAGYVAFASWLRGSSLLVVIDHGAGYVSLYGGNQALAVAAGEWVEAGAVIATSGRGTDSLGPGLYFELRYQGRAQNPAEWLDFTP